MTGNDPVSPRAQRRKTTRLGTRGNPCTISDLCVQECLLGVKLAESCTSAADLQERLVSQLPQNSPDTRRRYAQRIVKCLFPNGSLDSSPLAVWRAYHNEQILLDHFRARYLEAVPLVGKFVLGPLALIEVGQQVCNDTVRAFISRECGQVVPRTAERLPTNLSKLGFLVRANAGLIRTIPTYDPTSVVLELHRVFGQSPSTTTFREIVAHPFWRYVGVPDEATLERILYTAVIHRLLTKFVKSDELNQVTTGHSYAELLALRLCIPK